MVCVFLTQWLFCSTGRGIRNRKIGKLLIPRWLFSESFIHYISKMHQLNVHLLPQEDKHYRCACISYMNIRLRTLGKLTLTMKEMAQTSIKLEDIAKYVQNTGRSDKDDLFLNSWCLNIDSRLRSWSLPTLTLIRISIIATALDWTFCCWFYPLVSIFTVRLSNVIRIAV